MTQRKRIPWASLRLCVFALNFQARCARRDLAERRYAARRRFTGGEVDGISRQLARYIDRIAARYVPGIDVWMIYRHDRFGRAALVGLGIAGGLVPSPTALVVLLGAIGLGRTWFGVGLVISYGLGMAATLTAAGLLLVGLRDRLDPARLSDRLRHRTARLAAATPVLTALLVLVVGLGLVARGVTGI